MIKLIHRYKQSIGIVFLFVAACFAISGVGVDILHGGGRSNRDAITIDDHGISYNELQVAERRLELQYRQMFGENYASLAQSFGLNLTRQAMDNLIDAHLLEREAEEVGFAASGPQVKEYIQSRFFDPQKGGAPFSPEQYRVILQNMGMTSRQFEAQVQADIVRTSLTGLVSDVALVSSKDVEAKLLEQETKHTITVARLTAGSLLNDVPAPSDEEITKYYESNATDYEIPAKVAFDYVVFQPSDFEAAVQVLPQDIEFAYSEAPQRFSVPEQARISSIKILYPKESDPAKMASAREKAKKAHSEATSGRPFPALVTTYSDDIPTKLAGGNRGWIARGKNSESFDKAVFETSAGSVAPLIEEDWGFEIVKVEEKKAAGQRSLDEARGEIEAEIKRREAPTYAAAAARELLQKLRAPGITLADVAKEQKVPVLSTDGLLDESSDPAPNLKGLTGRVLGLAGTEPQIPVTIDIGDTVVLVVGKEFKQPTTAPLQDVRERVIQSIKLREARKLASERAQALLEAAKGPERSLKALSEAQKASVSQPAEITRANMTSPQLVGVPDELKTEAFKVRQAPALVDQVFEAGDAFLVAQVTSVKAPDLNSEETKKKLEEYRSQAIESERRAMLEATLAQLKSRSDIDIDQRLLVSN